MKFDHWVLSCEHGGNEIPAAYTHLFAEAAAILSTHRGWDPGALALFRQLKPLADFAHSSTKSRLLVELNRSLHHPSLFSQFSKGLTKEEKEEVLRQYYIPYRTKVEGAIANLVSAGSSVLHLSIHSFTPVLNGEVRRADIGLLFDPRRQAEKSFCQSWKTALKKVLPEMKVRFNYPYKGTADGFTTYLRKKHPSQYAGIEFELNQQWANNLEVYIKICQSLKALKENTTG